LQRQREGNQRGGDPRYLEYIQAHRSERTYKSYRYTLDTLLRTSYTKTHVDAVTRQDIVNFMTFCYDRGLQARTVYDKLVVVLQFFKRNGKSHLIEPSDGPGTSRPFVPVYEHEELEGMFRVATGSESIFLKFLLSSGFRDREVRYVLWLDLDFEMVSFALRPSRAGSSAPRTMKRELCPCRQN